MSKLQRWRSPTHTVFLPIEDGFDKDNPEVIDDHKLVLQGFSLPMMTELVAKHQAEMTALFGVFMQSDGKPVAVSIGDVKDIGTALLQSAPTVAGDIIALAAGDPIDGENEAGKAAQTLPFPVQIEALENIGRLTFDAQGGPKKVLEVVTRILNGMTGILQESARGSLRSR